MIQKTTSEVAPFSTTGQTTPSTLNDIMSEDKTMKAEAESQVNDLTLALRSMDESDLLYPILTSNLVYLKALIISLNKIITSAQSQRYQKGTHTGCTQMLNVKEMFVDSFMKITGAITFNNNFGNIGEANADRYLSSFNTFLAATKSTVKLSIQALDRNIQTNCNSITLSETINGLSGGSTAILDGKKNKSKASFTTTKNPHQEYQMRLQLVI